MCLRRVIVIGAGIIGLSSAVAIAEKIKNVDIEVIADLFESDTTSSGAGGLWAPEFAHGLLRGESASKLRDLATQTYYHARDLTRNPDASQIGVFLIPFYKVYYHPQYQALHWWKDVVPNYRQISNEEINTIAPGLRDGYTFTSVITDCSRYLPYLKERLIRAGGRISQRKISSLHQLTGQYDVVVNCSGRGAKDLVSDVHMTSNRAQVVQVEAPWIHYALEVEPANGTDKYRFYVIPRCNEVILGGTQYNAPGTDVSLEDKDAILTNTASFVPSLKRAKFKRDWVGVRPNRSTGLRLEKETITSGSKQLQVRKITYYC
nr:D-aspartate oxidase-like [Lytechinus pictus]